MVDLISHYNSLPAPRYIRRSLLGTLTALSVILVSGSFISAPALASPLKVFDCNGNVRASKEVPPSAPSDVSIEVVTGSGEPANGARITLTNKQTGEVRTATSVEGIATFESILDGYWILGAEDNSLLFSIITLEDPIPPVIAYGGAAGAGAAGAGMIGLGIIEIDNRNSSSEPPPAPTPIPTPVPTKDPLCPDCNPDDEAPPIDDFFEDRAVPPATPAAGGSTAQGASRPQAPAKAPPPGQKTQGTDCFISDDVDPVSPFR